MRQYVVSKLNNEAEFRKEDLISVKSGKIVYLHDVLNRQLKDYVSSVAKHRTKQLSGISKMADDEFRREFIDSDEELKTTILYGFLTKVDVFRTEDDEEYILGLAKHGGFKMVTMNFDNVVQEDLVDTSDDFLEYIEKAKSQEEHKQTWAKSIKSAKEFIASSKVNVKPIQAMQKTRLAMTRPKIYSKDLVKDLKIDKVVSGLSAGKVGAKGILYLNQKELDEAMETLDEANKADFLSRLEKVGDGFLFKTITPEQLQLDYQKLVEKLRIEQEKVAKGGAKGESYKAAVKGMQDFKGMVEESARKFANLNVKEYMRGLSKQEKKETYKDIVQKRKEYWNLLYNKEDMKRRGLTVTASGQLHKILPKGFREDQPRPYVEKTVRDKKTGKVYTKLVRQSVPRTMDYFKWSKREVGHEWRKRQRIRNIVQKKLDKETAKQKQAFAYINRAIRATNSKSSRYTFNLNEANKVTTIMITPAYTVATAKEKTKILKGVVNRIKKQKNTDKWNKQHTWNRRNKEIYNVGKLIVAGEKLKGNKKMKISEAIKNMNVTLGNIDKAIAVKKREIKGLRLWSKQQKTDVHQYKTAVTREKKSLLKEIKSYEKQKEKAIKKLNPVDAKQKRLEKRRIAGLQARKKWWEAQWGGKFGKLKRKRKLKTK